MVDATNHIYTIGHSTHSIEDFINAIKSYKIEMLIDIRTIPRSKHNPQFNEDTLNIELENSNIKYVHLPSLGGLRHTTKNSKNKGWHNLSFRGFADYMQTSQFWQGIEELEELGKKFEVVIMCAEVLPWRCHRSLIADVLTVHKWEVYHIINNKIQIHKITSFLKVQKGEFIYAEEKDLLDIKVPK